MVDFHLAAVFQARDDTLTGTLAFVDIASLENLNGLVIVGEKLLKKSVPIVDFDTAKAKLVHPETTNQEALIRVAGVLSRERAERNKVHELKSSSPNRKDAASN
ncbi:hypothetical protein ACFX1S_043520 [Malus domestica]